MSDKPQPIIPNAVGRLDDFVEKMKQGKTIAAAHMLDSERDRRFGKIRILREQLAREESACEEIDRTRKTLSSMIAYNTGMSDSDFAWSYPGWRNDFDQLSTACGGEPVEWFPDEVPATEPEPELDAMRVLATAAQRLDDRRSQGVPPHWNHVVRDAISLLRANAGDVKPYKLRSENNG